MCRATNPIPALDAIILSDIGKRTFEKNEAGDEDIVLKRFIRIQIVNKNGLDAGNVTLHLNTQAQYHNPADEIAR